MGISPLAHWAEDYNPECCCKKGCKCNTEPYTCRNNPNPNNFKILDICSMNDCVIARIEYPNCTNFEGKKILVFKGISIQEVNQAKAIDPSLQKECTYLTDC